MAESAVPSFSDDDALAALHREMAGTLRNLAYAMLRDRSLADDAVQEAFLLLSVKHEEVPVEARPGWLVRTLQYSALNLRRKQQRQRQTEQRWLVREQADGYTIQPEALEQLERTEELSRMRMAMGRLPEAQQSIVRLRLVEERSFQQIADQLDVPIGTVLSRMRLAVEKLRSILHE